VAKNRVEVLKISKTINYSQIPLVIKVGMDSDITVNILKDLYMFTPILTEISNKRIQVYIHKRSTEEIPNALVRKYGRTRDEADKELREFIKNHSVKIVPIIKGNPILKKLEIECRKRKIAIHRPDSYIISDFKVLGITKAYSGNDHFLDACAVIGIQAIKTPTPEKALRDKIREALGRRTKPRRK